MKQKFFALSMGLALCVAQVMADEEEAIFSLSSITPAAALKAAQAALAQCRADGYQATVAVVDRSGVPLVMLRDRLAGWHTVDVAIGKARSAVTFKTPTGEMVEHTAAGNAQNGIRFVPGVIMIAGGKPIMGAGSMVGGIGVSGAPGGDKDDVCADAGIAAVQDDLDF